jgi:hypothetical protein
VTRVTSVSSCHIYPWKHIVSNAPPVIHLVSCVGRAGRMSADGRGRSPRDLILSPANDHYTRVTTVAERENDSSSPVAGPMVKTRATNGVPVLFPPTDTEAFIGPGGNRLETVAVVRASGAT